jgi:hypothetical protein
MRAILSAVWFCLGAAGPLAAQVAAPPEVTSSAVAAVQDLGKQVVLGRHQIAIDRMYPHWKDSLAKQGGGMEKLEAKLAEISRMMAEQGIQVISFKPDPERRPTAYEVWPGREVVNKGGKQVEELIYKKWLLIIPTVTEYRVTRPAERGAPPRIEVITTKGFQVAISDKDKSDWTFIDGSGARVSDLRRLFITLPENMELPEIERFAGKNR